MFIEPVFGSSVLPRIGKVSTCPSFFHSYVGSGYEDTSSFIDPGLPRCSCCFASTFAVETVERRCHRVNALLQFLPQSSFHKQMPFRPE